MGPREGWFGLVGSLPVLLFYHSLSFDTLGFIINLFLSVQEIFAQAGDLTLQADSKELIMSIYMTVSITVIALLL